MTEAKSAGRRIGLMLLVQFVGLMIGYVSLGVLATSDYLATAAGNAARIRAGVLVLLAVGAVTIAISINGWRTFREYSRPMAAWLIVLAAIMFVVQVVDGVHIMTMLGLSQLHADGGSVANELAAATRLTRRYAHFFELMSIDFWLVMFYAILLRFALIPRLLAGFALLTVLSQFIFVPLTGFLGHGINTNFGIGLAFGMVSIIGWLLLRGFDETNRIRL